MLAVAAGDQFAEDRSMEVAAVVFGPKDPQHTEIHRFVGDDGTTIEVRALNGVRFNPAVVKIIRGHDEFRWRPRTKVFGRGKADTAPPEAADVAIAFT